jgi:TonB family protein
MHGTIKEMRVRNAGLALAMLLLAAGASAQLAPSTDQGPMNIPPPAPKPDSNGVYPAGFGVAAPLIIQRAPATYPPDAPPDSVEGESVLSFVVGVDGNPADIQVVRTHGAAFDAAAIDAIRQSKFAPGTVGGKPVPVRIFARTRFFADMRPAFPRIQIRIGQPMGSQLQTRRGFPALQSGNTPPRPLNTAEPEYSDDARKKKIQGVVIVSVLVDEEGIPIDPQIVRPLDLGLDEKAIECALKYRFRPAMKEGTPVAARISIEVNFRLY